MKRVAKILGADVELGNIFQRATPGEDANDLPARLLLAEIDGIPSNTASITDAYASPFAVAHAYSGAAPARAYGYDAQDWGRKFLQTNGGAAYIDLSHIEMCTPEVRSARDFVAAHHANLRIARSACEKANANLMPGELIVVFANNSDRLGNSWGAHTNVMVSRELWEQVCTNMFPALFVLVAFQVSSIIFTGQGKCGAENGKPWVPYQISQRGDFFECVAGLQTTYRRPIANTRDESHATPDLARMHIIFYDNTLTHVSNYLKAGVIQLVLAMMEAGWCGTETMLENPLVALTAWGHDPDLRATAPLYDGRRVRAVEHQQMFARAARRFVEAGTVQEFVPEAQTILALWEDTLAKLERRDFPSLAGRLDWVMKRKLLERMMDRNPDLAWDSPSIRAADLLFANLDPRRGLYWPIEAAGGTEQIAAEADIRRAMHEPPVDTRAWSRTMLLRQVGRAGIESVNWDEIRLRLGAVSPARASIRFDDPRQFTRADMLRAAADEPADTRSSTAITNQPEKG